MRLTQKEKNLIIDLLHVASSGWYVDDSILPKGVESTEEAEKMVKALLKKFGVKPYSDSGPTISLHDLVKKPILP